MSVRGAVAAWLAAGVAAALGWSVLAAVGPSAPDDLVVCLFRRLSGVSCPSCGLTRAFLHLFDGDLAGALRLHPAAPILTLELAIAWLAWGWRASGRALGPAGWAWAAPWAAAHGVALVGLWLGRLATGTLPN